ncbi:MAG: ArsR family transcriptional regulator [Nevskiaceae bacterium]|nr:MAG: ArsR family transcriptional regulator [Nevskiaceae bacterium]
MSGTTSGLGEAWVQHLRIAILRSMLDCPARSAHESLIVDLVGAVHIVADREQVREQLVWFHGEGLVIAEEVHGSLAAVLTEQGAWVAEGKSGHTGVKRPNVTASTARQVLSISLDRLKR